MKEIVRLNASRDLNEDASARTFAGVRAAGCQSAVGRVAGNACDAGRLPLQILILVHRAF